MSVTRLNPGNPLSRAGPDSTSTTVRSALSRGDRAAASARSADGFTALHLAAYLGGAPAVEALLHAGADASAVAENPMRVQPLHSAAALGEIAARLRESGSSRASD